MQYIVDHVVDLGGKSARLSDIAEIEGLDYPPEVNPGQQFSVSYQAHNLSNATQLLWGEILNTDTDTVIPGSSWQIEVPAGLMYNSDAVISGIEQDLHGKVIIGHVEYAGPDIWKMAAAVMGVCVVGLVGMVWMK